MSFSSSSVGENKKAATIFRYSFFAVGVGLEPTKGS